VIQKYPLLTYIFSEAIFKLSVQKLKSLKSSAKESWCCKYCLDQL